MRIRERKAADQRLKCGMAGYGREILEHGLAGFLRTCLALGLIVLAMTGCGDSARDNIQSDQGSARDHAAESSFHEESSREIYEVQVERETLSLPDHLLGVQFEGERTIAFYSRYDQTLGRYDGCLYEYDIDQDCFRTELEEIPQELLQDAVNWYRTSEGNYYAYETGSFVCLDGEGEELCRQETEKQLAQITETKYGETAMLFGDGGVGIFTLRTRKLENKGRITEGDTLILAPGYQESLLVLEARKGIYELRLSDLERTYYLQWDNAPYALEGEVLALRQTSARSCELLLYQREDGSYRRDVLTTEPIREDGRTVLTCRTGYYVTPSLQSLAAAFNQSQSDYFLIIEHMEEGEDLSTFLQRTAMEIVAGRGPDLITDSALNSPVEMIRQGVLEELTPYLEGSKMAWSDFYPAAYGGLSYEGGVYGAAYEQSSITLYLNEEAADAMEQKNIHGLLDILEEEPDRGETFNKDYYYTPAKILSTLLSYSEDLLGLVDWEENTCSFEDPLWYRLLEAAQRWGMEEGVSYSRSLATTCVADSLESYTRTDGECREAGMVPVGYPLKDTMASFVSAESFGINALSAHKEGAWKFLEFCLSQEGQDRIVYFPVVREVGKSLFEEALKEAEEKRRAAEELAREYREQGLPVPEQEPDVYKRFGQEGGYIITKERIREMEDLLENSRSIPLRNQTLVDIVIEESGAYFSGDKTAQEVTDIIGNRVQLYLDERG